MSSECDCNNDINMTIQNIVSIVSFVLFAVSEYRSYKNSGPRGVIQIVTATCVNLYDKCHKKTEVINDQSAVTVTISHDDIKDII